MAAWPRLEAVEVEGSGQSQIVYLEGEQTGLAEKLADRDEERKGEKDGFHVWGFSNQMESDNILPKCGILEEEQILKKENREFHFLCIKLKILY